jgi:hypothetical protein
MGQGCASGFTVPKNNPSCNCNVTFWLDSGTTNEISVNSLHLFLEGSQSFVSALSQEYKSQSFAPSENKQQAQLIVDPFLQEDRSTIIFFQPGEKCSDRAHLAQSTQGKHWGLASVET